MLVSEPWLRHYRKDWWPEPKLLWWNFHPSWGEARRGHSLPDYVPLECRQPMDQLGSLGWNFQSEHPDHKRRQGSCPPTNLTIWFCMDHGFNRIGMWRFHNWRTTPGWDQATCTDFIIKMDVPKKISSCGAARQPVSDPSLHNWERRHQIQGGQLSCQSYQIASPHTSPEGGYTVGRKTTCPFNQPSIWYGIWQIHNNSPLTT